jgi:hypothetical protein
LKEAPKNDPERHHKHNNDHLDAAAGVDGIEVFYDASRTLAMRS